VFEAAGAGACLITDAWLGVEKFFEPDAEILVAENAEDVVRHLCQNSTEQAKRIGNSMRSRALRQHTYEIRAREVDDVLRNKTNVEADCVDHDHAFVFEAQT
jgi:spore maturation protein CgeB